MRIQVKICGVTRRDALDAAIEAGVDWIGLNFYPRSPRVLTPAQAVPLAEQARGTKLVGLFVEPSEAEVAAVLAHIDLAALQLYATPARAAEFRQRFGLPVWRAAHVATRADLPLSGEGADALLIEPRPAADATRPGGNGTALDWSLLRGWSPPLPWLLGGGLTPENVAAAVAASGAGAVDVSSGVEASPGVKSPALIRAFTAAARAAPPPPA